MGNLTDGMFCSQALLAVDGARRFWWYCPADMRMALFDCTHGTNRYHMKLGCITTRDANNKIKLLAVSLVKREDAAVRSLPRRVRS